MEFNEVENLSEAQIMELYNEVVEGPEHLSVAPAGLYYFYDSSTGLKWMCERLGAFCRESDQARLYMDQCYNFETGQSMMRNEFLGAYGCDPTK